VENKSMPFEVVFGVVLLTRFLLPFTILRYPLPGVVACLIVDGVDQSVFQSFGYDPEWYQGYDKAMDVFYLGVAYISTMRNWISLPAFNVSRFLFFYRQIGVVAFELTQVRALLMIFPNTFEYFFIAYEAIRSRWNSARFQAKFWVGVAAFIWIVIKLPQEYWIHIAQLDFTDTWKEVDWFAPLIVIGGVTILLVLWFVVRPRLDPADHRWQIVAPPIPEAIDEASERTAYMARYGKVWSVATLEKTFLIGLLFVIFASVLPTTELNNLRLFSGVAVFVVLNAVISLWVARRHYSTESVVATFVARIVVNFGLIVVLDVVFGTRTSLGDLIFFLMLFSVLITLYDRYRPVLEYRFHQGDVSTEQPDAGR
jgi:hypothetical protein